jgi:hypothetical protein
MLKVEKEKKSENNKQQRQPKIRTHLARSNSFSWSIKTGSRGGDATPPPLTDSYGNVLLLSFVLNTSLGVFADVARGRGRRLCCCDGGA